MRNRPSNLLIGAAALILAAALASGCSSSPADQVTGMLEALKARHDTEASAFCYDEYSFRQIEEGLGEAVRPKDVRVVEVESLGNEDVRKQDYEGKKVQTVEELLSGPQAELDARFKPLLEVANAELASVQLEYDTAVRQLQYAAETYGRNMPQYWAEQTRIRGITPRLQRAQAKVNELNAAKQAELDGLKKNALEQHDKQQAAHDKDLERTSASLPAWLVEVRLGTGKDASRTFVVVDKGGPRVYSLEEATEEKAGSDLKDQ